MKRLLLLLILSTPAVAATTLPFIEDNYPKARAEAMRRNVPMFVDVWAPW